MKTIVLICNYNQQKTNNLKNTLDALKQNKLQNTIIGIIDNASKDKSKQVITEYADLFDVVIFNKRNLGKAKALNKLLQYIINTHQINLQQDVLISLDSDIIMCKDFIKLAEQTFSKYSQCNLFTTYGKSCITDIDIDNCHTIKISNLIKVTDTISKIQTFIGVCGCIIAMRLYNFIAVNGYRENLGKNKTAAIYGGDDAYLALDFMYKFPNTYTYFYLGDYHIHPKSTDIEYQNWKIKQCKLMAIGKNNQVDSIGFYDS